MNTRWKPSVTVATVIEREGRFLLVEDTPSKACARTTRRATWIRVRARWKAWRAKRWGRPPGDHHRFTPTALVGVYLSRSGRNG